MAFSACICGGSSWQRKYNGFWSQCWHSIIVPFWRPAILGSTSCGFRSWIKTDSTKRTPGGKARQCCSRSDFKQGHASPRRKTGKIDSKRTWNRICCRNYQSIGETKGCLTKRAATILDVRAVIVLSAAKVQTCQAKAQGQGRESCRMPNHRKVLLS